ncbi:uncharacterized protein N7515_009465 [Penicillium bovifimosum]|uniref:GPI-anchored cell surface glycoprotein n=1 Tax=Penicillium bovifimosum TaxID=126998 RepID=A0A9W9GJK8_9EURO|nr:uncharacterized protein N7515_009465 [Penicillium bovifimosum]KAJ5121504.1 hypothetical protein N7515_009465 [Penicillium bovifimosum]
MSLNGLDSAPVLEAYQSALADAGGWFLLHYVARDEVALHERGTGGVPEIRNVIDSYEECSPLYGFLQYRRRKVIIRYMPEGLSRLVIARSNVQFHSVTEKFTPNDTVLALSKASDLTESALSSACLLHTASTSITSSSSSLRRRRLMEITEDAEENGTKDEAAKPIPPPRSEARPSSRSSNSEATVVPPIEIPVDLPPTSPGSITASVDIRPPPSRASSRATTTRESPIEPQSATMSPKSMDSDRPSSKYRNILDEFPRPSDEARMSTQSARPSLRELERAAGITPKVKLGPRPSVDSSGRPRTAGSSRITEQRPVATLPTNMRSSSLRRSTADVPRPRSQGSTFAAKPTSRVPPVPPLLVPPPSIPISRPQLSPGAKSLGALSTSSGLTPEKERLMKALQQRKKNMAKRAEETKKKQLSDEEEIRTQEQIARHQDENKENLIQIHYPEPEEPPFKPVVIQQDKREVPSEILPVLPEPAPESVLEPAPEAVEAVAEPAVTPESEQPVKHVGAQAEQIADDIVGNTENEPSSSPSSPIADSTVSINGAVQQDAQTEAPQSTPEDGPSTEHEDPSLAPPSFSVDIPLDDKSSGDPQQVSGDVPETNSEVEPLSQPTEEPISPEVPESIPLPATPAITPPDSAGTQTPTAPVSDALDPNPADEQSLHPIPEKTEYQSLDQRRKVHLDPIQVPTPEYSDDDNLLSDDAFMEELTSATVQEARPISVKSPNARDHGWRSSRAVSSPYSMRSPSPMQALAVGRSVSGSYSESGPSTPVLMAKKINVSSGIHSRIKALEKFSSREGTPVGASPALNAPSTASSFENLRKRASISLPRGHHDPSSPDAAQTTEDYHAPSSNRHDRRVSVDTRHSNSVSVTARIVRDADVSPGSSGVEPSESDVLNLQASPLTVEHETIEEPSSQVSATGRATRPQDRSTSISSNGSSRPASSRPGSRPAPPSRSRTDETIQSVSSTSEEKKSSRASRLMRRMSSLTSTSRRSIIGALSSPVKEEEYAPTFTKGSGKALGSSSSQIAEPIDIGEVNVQFPETLLWKRRVMRIDEQGYVVLAPGTTDATARNMTKRYHLTEFRTPCLPEEDMQELPNSILLDFLDGNTLQCACESRQGQASTLQTLLKAHSAYQQ